MGDNSPREPEAMLLGIRELDKSLADFIHL